LNLASNTLQEWLRTRPTSHQVDCDTQASAFSCYAGSENSLSLAPTQVCCQWKVSASSDTAIGLQKRKSLNYHGINPSFNTYYYQQTYTVLGRKHFDIFLARWSNA
jgi:hypothetical protein